MARSKFKYCQFLILFLWCIILVKSDKNLGKSSLTFVIDNTYSMTDDIDQVKEAAHQIFDTVMNSQKSQIENFVLVTFNDPDIAQVKLWTITRDREVFKNTLDSIKVTDGNYDCPEFCMTGIKLALENSHFGSNLYVFTDASAKDYEIYENVENLASNMQAQIVFVLTGECGLKQDEDYQVYHKLAFATSGEVFHLGKQDVNIILNYVRYTIEEPPTYIDSHIFPPGYGNKFNYTLDNHYRDPLISVSGTEPKIDVTAPDGTKPQIEELADLDEIVIIKFKEPQPGTHNVVVGSKSNTTVKVVARSEIKFAFGFSNFIPTSFDDVTSKPLPDQKCHISIKLTEGLIDLHTLLILDMDGKQINEVPLMKLDDKEKIHATDLVEVPNTMFRIAIVGSDPKTKSNITRKASSPVEPQRITAKVISKSPTVTIGQEEVVVDYNNPLKLTCKINGYPKPNITWWIEKKPGVRRALPTNVLDFKLPYDYISVLELEHVKDNATYKCEATNIQGENAKETIVQVNNFLEVLEEPKDTTIQYNKEGNIYCKINSYPKANITWYKNGINDRLTNNSNINIETNNLSSVLRIKTMDIDNVGTYICEATNGIERKLLKAQIDIDGGEPPVIDKDVKELRIKLHEDTNVTCSILKGVPKPTIRWYFKKDKSSKSIEMPTWLNQQVVYIRNAQKIYQGIYACVAKNALGKDDKEVDVVFEYPPHIKNDRKYIQVDENQNVFLTCQVEGNPSPSVEWYKNDKLYIKKDKDFIYENNTLRINSISVVDSANYTCLASNNLGVTNKTIYVKVIVPVKITPRDMIFNVLVGSRFELSCQATGVPTPRILWWKLNAKEVSQTIKTEVTDRSTLLFERIQLKDSGIYKCNAWNSRWSSDVASYTVRVHAPPVIENKYPEKVFKPVEGDLVLRINCQATGNPKPTINWIKDGFYVALGDSYNVEDGTLVIKNIDKADSGNYVCEAVNSLGRDTEAYEVEVFGAPPIKDKSRKVYLLHGETANINCNIPRKRTDRLRWFKNGKFLKDGELTLYKAKQTDTGYYSCRVNYFNKSATDSIEVKVGFRPVFKTKEPEYYDVVSGNTIYLNCEAFGVPVPKIQWLHNNVNINSSDFIYTVEPTLKNEGLYDCKVANNLGSIVRKFNVRSRDCVINFRNETSNQPLILSLSSSTPMKTLQISWPMFDINEEDSMIIPRYEYVNLFCPSGFTKFPFSYVPAFCDSGSNFKVVGKSMEFSQIQCTEKNRHIVREIGPYCLPKNANSKKMKISFKVLRDTIDVYEVCFDTITHSPIYAKVHMAKHSINTMEEPELSDKKYFKKDFDEMYDCKQQSNVIETILKKQWHKDDGCCFRKRQLVNIKDVFPGAPQEAISSYFNIVPQWGTCNSENWDQLERSVQVLSKLSYSDIIVWTGVSGHLYLPTASGKKRRIRIVDKTWHRQPVPKYLWKVIQNPSTSSSVAVIQMNTPDLSLSDVNKHILCHDICKSIEWLNWTNWRDVNKGYIYCCNLNEFTNAFNFVDVFEPHYNLLKSAA